MGLLSCFNTTLILIHESSHSTLKAFVNSKKDKTGVEQNLFFSKLIALSVTSPNFFSISLTVNLSPYKG